MGNHNSRSEIRTEISTSIKSYLNNEVNELVKSVDNTTNKVITNFITTNKTNINATASNYQSINFTGAKLSRVNIDLTNLSEMRVNLQAISNITTNNVMSIELQNLIKDSIAQRAKTDTDLQTKINASDFIHNKSTETQDGEINKMIDSVGKTIDDILTSSSSDDIKRTKITNCVTTQVNNTLNQTTNLTHILDQLFKTTDKTINIAECVASSLSSQKIDFSKAVIEDTTIKGLNQSNITLGSKCFLTNMTINTALNKAINDYFTNTDADAIASNRMKDDEVQKGNVIDEDFKEQRSFFGDFMNNIVYIAAAVAVVVIIGIIAFVFIIKKNKNIGNTVEQVINNKLSTSLTSTNKFTFPTNQTKIKYNYLLDY